MATRHESDINRLIDTVNGAIGANSVTVDAVETLVMNLAPIVAPDLDSADLSYVVERLQQLRVIDMTPGLVFASPKHEPWLEERKTQISWSRWEAYRRLLSSKAMAPKVLDSMHARNERVLDLAGDPLLEGPWTRRGLVIGDVQSGKTANYLALFNKAADAGYKVFILLAGNTDKLRQQTQARVDEGFTGRDTRQQQLTSVNPELGIVNKIGIGEFGDIRTNALTTYNQDFFAGLAKTVVHLDQDSTPTVFVIKKNKTILRNLTTWLQNSNSGGKIKAPLLLLDDEADYASINTNQSDAEATAINRGIRDLLSVFDRNSYIGFTATPFANILIDENNEEDLYPRNFIYSLESPSNYFGPNDMFESDPQHTNRFLVSLEDGETSFPFKHKATLEVASLPSSLTEAVRLFFLTNAIRDLRSGQASKPRSMLVNVSRFVKVQYQVYDLLGEFVSNTRDALKYGKRSQSAEWQAMQGAFEKHFSHIPENWESVETQLVESIEDIRVHIVNSQNKSDAWESVFDGPRARVIAVGGDVLSRGLTLEGLSTSYFYRRSLAYDTLMQMGRWFGYRDGYLDLCRLWIDDEVALWYKDIAEAIQELRDDLAEMASRKLEPTQFGLAVRCHPGAMMMVTARNKALASDRQPKSINVRDISTETSRIEGGQSIFQNWDLLLGFSADLLKECGKPERTAQAGRAVWKQVPQGLVGNFLHDFVAAESQTLLADKALSNYVRSNVAQSLRTWDVVIMSGQGRVEDSLLGGTQLVERSVKLGPDGHTLYVGGKNQRLGGSADIGLTLAPTALAALQAKKVREGLKVLSSHHYRDHLIRPLLIVYPIQTKTQPAEATNSPSDWPAFESELGDPPLVGISVAFPRNRHKEQPSPVLYQVNSVWTKLNSITLSDPDDFCTGDDLDEDQL